MGLWKWLCIARLLNRSRGISRRMQVFCAINLAVLGASIKETLYLCRIGLSLVIIQFAVNHNFMSVSLTVLKVWHLAVPVIAGIVWTGRLIN